MYKTKDGYVRLHTNFPQLVPLLSISKKYTHLFPVTNKVYLTSCSVNPQKRPSLTRSLNGLQKSLKQRRSDGTSAPLRCARTTLWTIPHRAYSKGTSPPYPFPRSMTRPSEYLPTQEMSNTRLKGSVYSTLPAYSQVPYADAHSQVKKNLYRQRYFPFPH
jgi:hypothetical protein